MLTQTFTGDPSCLKQHFPRLSVDIYCCRYWWLRKWEYNMLSFPFWRIYYNRNAGGIIEYEGRELSLEPDRLYLIAPNTDYRSRILGRHIPKNGYSLEGGDIGALPSAERDAFLAEAGTLCHLFIHFTLVPMDSKAQPGICSFPLDDSLRARIDELCAYLIENHDAKTFNIHIYWLIHSLIGEAVRHIDERVWRVSIGDVRVQKVVDYIESHYDCNLSNVSLANMVCMSPNSFSRLFKEQMGVSLQKFIKKKRIDYACSLLLTTDMTIDEITSKAGFQNRFHFTRLFAEITGTTPVRYRKLFS